MTRLSKLAVKKRPATRNVAKQLAGVQASDQRSTTGVDQGQEPVPRVRRIGKRSDPAFRPTTVFIRKETQRRASRLLEDQEMGKDLSDLIEELLAKWIAEQSHA